MSASTAKTVEAYMAAAKLKISKMTAAERVEASAKNEEIIRKSGFMDKFKAVKTVAAFTAGAAKAVKLTTRAVKRAIGLTEEVAESGAADAPTEAPLFAMGATMAPGDSHSRSSMWSNTRMKKVEPFAPVEPVSVGTKRGRGRDEEEEFTQEAKAAR